MARRVRTWGSVRDPWGSVDRAWGAPYGTIENHRPEYHVVLGGRGLIITGRDRSLAQTFAAPLRTTAPSSAGRIGEQAVEITGWQGGEGTLRHLPATPSRYRRGSGIDIFSESGSVGLGPHMAAPAALQTSLNAIYAMLPYKGWLMLGAADGKVYRWDGTSLTEAADTGKTTGGVRSLGIIQGRLYIGNGQDDKVWRWLGVTDLADDAENFTIGQAPSPFNTTVTGCYAMSEFFEEGNGTVLMVGAEASGGGIVAKDPNTSGTTTALLVAAEPKISALVQYEDLLIAVNCNETSRVSRLYSLTTDFNTEHLVRVSDAVFTCAATLNGRLYIADAIQGRIWVWDGNDLTIYRQLGSDLNPYAVSITGMCVWRGGLWVSIVDEDGTIALLRDNGSEDWSRPVTGLSGTTPGPLAVYQDQIHYTTQTTGATKVFRTDGTFRASGEVESALIDGGLPGETKLWTEVSVSHSALVTDQAILIQYQLEDDGGWTNLGSPNVEVGTTSFTRAFPSSTLAKLIAFKILLEGPSGGATALKVFDLTALFRTTKGALHEWTVQVRLEGKGAERIGEATIAARRLSLADGTSSETLTGEELCDAIQALVDAGEPVTFFDVDRREQYIVLIEEWSDSINMTLSQGEVMRAGWDLTGRLRLREV